jgi:AcrR family transcriptional regulator
VGLRERKKAETRTALSWAAIRLTVERGFDNVRVEDIAEAAGVSPRTFNNYFSSKGEAIAARHLDRMLRGAEVLRNAPPDKPLWDAVLEAALSQLTPGPEVLENPVPDHDQWAEGVRLMMAEPALQPELGRAHLRAETEMAKAIAERTGADVDHDLFPNLAASSIMSAIGVSQQLWVRQGGTTPIDVLIKEAIRQIATGFKNP